MLLQGVFGNELLDVDFSVIAHAYMLEPAIASHVTAEGALQCPSKETRSDGGGGGGGGGELGELACG